MARATCTACDPPPFRKGPARDPHPGRVRFVSALLLALAPSWYNLTMTCSRCGARVGPTDRYCARCGAATEIEEDAPAPAVADTDPGARVLHDLDRRLKGIEQRLAGSRMFHPGFLQRAFAVWVHHLVAAAIISFPVILLFLLLWAVVFLAGGLAR